MSRMLAFYPLGRDVVRVLWLSVWTRSVSQSLVSFLYMVLH